MNRIVSNASGTAFAPGSHPYLLPVHALLLLILGTLFGSLGLLGLQRSRSDGQADLSALLLGLVSCLVSLILLLVVAARALL